jgi:hypothetical protein
MPAGAGGSANGALAVPPIRSFCIKPPERQNDVSKNPATQAALRGFAMSIHSASRCERDPFCNSDDDRLNEWLVFGSMLCVPSGPRGAWPSGRFLASQRPPPLGAVIRPGLSNDWQWSAAVGASWDLTVIRRGGHERRLLAGFGRSQTMGPTGQVSPSLMESRQAAFGLAIEKRATCKGPIFCGPVAPARCSTVLLDDMNFLNHPPYRFGKR